MTNSQTPRSRAARARTATAANAAKLAAGWQRLNTLIPPDAVAALDRLVAAHGSKRAAIVAAIAAATADHATWEAAMNADTAAQAPPMSPRRRSTR